MFTIRNSREAELRKAGYVQGWPARATARTRAIDRATCRRLRCGNPSCRRRGLGVVAYCKAGAYSLVATCPSCGEQDVL